MRARSTGVALLLVAACSRSETMTTSPTDVASSTPRSETETETEPRRVLVTGFNDWKDLGEPPNVWRCRDNPSCRLLLGKATTEAPTGLEGPLVRMLREPIAEAAPIEWVFATMPVTWEAGRELPDYESYDVVVHLGLGVYDRLDTVFVEDGAYNRRVGADAAGQQRDEAIEARHGADVLAADERTGIATAVRSLDGQQFAGYRVRVMAARPDNSYLCNETHFLALQRVNESVERSGRLSQVFFVHIPYAQNDDYEGLAKGVGGVIRALVGDSRG